MRYQQYTFEFTFSEKNGTILRDYNLPRRYLVTEPSEAIGEGVYRRIRQDIIFGRLAPSQKLKLDALRDRYGASVSTLREILNRLCSEGFVVAEGQRGFEVEPVTAAGFREVAGMRLLLECHALEASFAAGDLEWEGSVVAAH